jgi:chromosome partitioning protein
VPEIGLHKPELFSNTTFYDRRTGMTEILSIANQKGGVGKTTTAVNLAAALGISNRKTLLVDCDPQANATTGFGIDKRSIDRTLYHGLIGEADINDLIVDCEINKLKIIPSRVELIGFDIEMLTTPHREKTLKRLLDQLEDNFDYIIIDCPPSLSLLTVNAMAAANAMLIPLQCEFYALEGLSQLLQTVKRIKHSLNASLKIAGILLTMFDTRTNLSHQVAENTKKYFKDLVFHTTIPRNVRLGEAPSFGKPILLYDAASIGAKSYLALAKEIINSQSKGS